MIDLVAQAPRGRAISDVVRESRAGLPLIYHLVASGRLAVDHTVRLDDGALLYHPETEAADEVFFLGRHHAPVWCQNA